MHGEYQFAMLNPETGTFEQLLDVKIGRFKLDSEDKGQI
jgi:hypothetical protein